MKRVLLRDRGEVKARLVMTTILENPSPGQGITYADMRKRDRLFEALEKHVGKNYVDFEDGDYDIFKELTERFWFGNAKRETKLILDDFTNAKAPEDTLHSIEGGKEKEGGGNVEELKGKSA